MTAEGFHEPMAFGAVVSALPPATYGLSPDFPEQAQAVVAFLLSAYQFTHYKQSSRQGHRLVIPEGVDLEKIKQIATGVKLARDLINTPANDLGPEELAAAVKSLFEEHGGTGSIIEGDALLKNGFPMVHAVGRASDRAPRLADFFWGNDADPKVTLVGKGVIFDSGGLNIKPGNSMALMKKDMGGAANVLGLASMIMERKLPVRLRVIVPCVENAIAGDSFRPGDILNSRKGLTVEIGNTDAEGRLILADALALADEEAPELLIDMATLTGAARVALGPDLPPFYTHDETFADELALVAEASADPMWRMPLWQPYQKYLDSHVADLNHINTTGAGFAGSVTAALFLSRFVEHAGTWAHFDIYGWSPSAKPGKPVGGEAQAIRALFDLLCERYEKK
ncbi:leucyl aminopeptidase family protein [Roseibium sp. RKSG952]|nr:leucyl aminopeptidase family protein [Roseibium sp. RKSG952]